jgi:hypothetical protein
MDKVQKLSNSGIHLRKTRRQVVADHGKGWLKRMKVYQERMEANQEKTQAVA